MVKCVFILDKVSCGSDKKCFLTGGRPDNWTSISTECLSLIESLTHKLSAEVSLQTHRQQPVLDPKVLGPALVNGHANGHTGV